MSKIMNIMDRTASVAAIAAVMFLLLSLFASQPVHAEVYKYTKSDGSVGFADSIQAVPEEYRSKATVVKGLRENETQATDATKAKPVEKAAGTDQKAALSFAEQAEAMKKAFFEKGYWKGAAAVAVFIIVFVLLGQGKKMFGHDGVWTGLKVVLFIGLLGFFFYAYSKEMSGIYDSLFKTTKGIESKVQIKKNEANKIGKE